jgi:hypothetical protein
MTIFLSQSDLTKGGLKLFLSNDLGQSQDAASVRWTVFSMTTGERISGERIQAVKKDVGQYCATWYSDVPTGSYKVLWEIEFDSTSEPQQLYQPFYVVDPSDYKCHGRLLIQEKPPVPGSLVFLPFSFLGPNDLLITIKDENGYPQDAYSIIWHIQEVHTGRAISPKSIPIHTATGSYYAPWIVACRGGEYKIVWEFQADATSPAQSASQSFSILGITPPFKITRGSVDGSKFIIPSHNHNCHFYVPYGLSCMSMPNRSVGCGSHDGRKTRFYVNSCSPIPHDLAAPPYGSECCDYEVSRQVHLTTQVLHGTPVFTNQAKFLIPTRIREVNFYITYTRGAPGGNAVFHLLWGNGTEEIQETVRDLDIVPEDSSRIAQNLFLQDLLGPTPVDDNPISYVLSVTVPGGVTTVRLVAAEGGVPASPGTIGITLTAST